MNPDQPMMCRSNSNYSIDLRQSFQSITSCKAGDKAIYSWRGNGNVSPDDNIPRAPLTRHDLNLSATVLLSTNISGGVEYRIHGESTSGTPRSQLTLEHYLDRSPVVLQYAPLLLTVILVVGDRSKNLVLERVRYRLPPAR
jgi:hypothetical protein